MNTAHDHLFIHSAEHGWKRIERSSYKSEADLQALIAEQPEVLESSQIGADEPARFMLVAREAGIPDSTDSAARWSVDHLLLDQHGIPTLVEVKRSSDTRIRREVVGQLLEYAANADGFWPTGSIREMALRHYKDEEGLNEAVSRILGETDPEQDAERYGRYWSMVEENQRAGRIRLLFVADVLPSELKRIIEFLNAKMRDVEVLGVELFYFASDDIKALVSKVVGQTEAVRAKRSNAGITMPTLDRQSMLDVTPEHLRAFVIDILDREREQSIQISWGVSGFSFRAIDAENRAHSILYCYPNGVKGEERPFLEGYLTPVMRETELGLRYAHALESILGIEKRGKYTFRLYLDTHRMESAMAVLQAANDIASEFSLHSRHSEESATAG